MKQFFREKGLVHQTTCSYTPEQNGVAERRNRTLLEIARAMLIESKTPRSFWPEALATSAYLLNCLPTKILNLQTPLQFLSTVAQIPLPLTLQPRIFGSSVFVHIPKHERTKLSPCAIKCVFVGYGINQKGYRCFDPKSNRIITTMDCDFLEAEYYYSHLAGQGESNISDKSSDPLSWLPMSSLPQTDPTEKVVRTTEPVPQIQPIATSGDMIQDSTPNLVSDVSPSEPSDPVNTITDNIIIDPETNPESDAESETQEEPEICDILEEQISEDIGGYILPPRSNKGVLPKRYSPDRICRKAKYSIANIARSQLSEMAQAFEVALYEEEEIPCTLEEAWRHKH